MKDLGSLHYFLGDDIFVSQYKYLQNLFVKSQMTGCKPCKTPCSSSARLGKTDGLPLVDPTPYRSLVVALQYLTFTHPDITFVVNHICQYMHAPTDVHFSALERILR